MENYQNQSSATQQMSKNPPPLTADELGNTLVLQPTDELGNSTYQQPARPTGFPGYNAGHDHGMLNRSRSSGSSSSEDDGQGGRRKKGMKEKVSRAHRDQQTHITSGGGTHEKKGLMEKIKDKIHNHQQHH